jgi:ribosomal protein S18 acetylase RimI-like enzyme
VLPEHRHDGCGKRLVGFAIDYIRKSGGKQVALGMLLESDVLKNWYLSLGFKEISTHKFPNLPFTVCFMQRDVNPLNSLFRRE